MTVKDLIEQLQRFPNDAEVKIEFHVYGALRPRDIARVQPMFDGRFDPSRDGDEADTVFLGMYVKP